MNMAEAYLINEQLIIVVNLLTELLEEIKSKKTDCLAQSVDNKQ